MSDVDITGVIHFDKEVYAKLDTMPHVVGWVAKKVVLENSRLMASHTRVEHLTGGTTDTRLKVRTGKLRASCKPLKLKVTPVSIESGIGFGTIYAPIHVGRKGQVNTIKAKKGKYLTIPLEAAMTKAGVLRGSAQSGAFAETFFAVSKKGSLILFGKQTYAKGKRAGEAKGNIVPLFLLKKQVQVKTRVHPEDIMAWMKPKVEASFIEEFNKKAK